MKVMKYKLNKNEKRTIVFVVGRDKDTDIHLSVRLSGSGAKATIIGLVLGKKDQHITIHTEQIHEAPETVSNLLVKAALYDEAIFTYDGIIRVDRRAQKSDAYQKNENLLLSPNAEARSDPALEILANDVRCTHGSTTGKLSEDQLWYLGSRGLSREKGEELLVKGFFEHAINAISDSMGQEKIRSMLWQIL